MTVTGQPVPGAVSQHVGMDLERQLGFLSGAFDHPVEAIAGKRSTALSHEYEGAGLLLAELAQLAQFIAADRMS